VGEKFGDYNQVATSQNTTCARATNGTVTCFGEITGSPQGKYKSVAVGADKACAIEDATDAIVCWDDSLIGSTPVDGAFSQLSLGAFRSAALRLDGSLVFF
jgi:hypothetical protein